MPISRAVEHSGGHSVFGHDVVRLRTSRLYDRLSTPDALLDFPDAEAS
jgi:hypothetical protein